MILSRASSMSPKLDDVTVVAHGHDGGLVHRRLARSAPENPGVPSPRRQVYAGSGVSPGVDLQDGGSLPTWLGSGISTSRSKRPGRNKAGSSTSGRLVAAMTTMPVVGRSRPSPQELVQGLLPLVVGDDRAPRFWPMASISSIKMIEGAPLAGIGEKVPDRRSPDADEHLDKAGSRQGQKGNGSASPATARAMSVLPLPGGPTIKTPRGPDRPRLSIAVGVLQEVDDLAHLAFGAFVAGNVEKRVGDLLVVDLRLRAPRLP